MTLTLSAVVPLFIFPPSRRGSTNVPKPILMIRAGPVRRDFAPQLANHALREVVPPAAPIEDHLGHCGCHAGMPANPTLHQGGMREVLHPPRLPIADSGAMHDRKAGMMATGNELLGGTRSTS